MIYNSPRIQQRLRKIRHSGIIPLLIQQARNARYGICSNYLLAPKASGEIDFY